VPFRTRLVARFFGAWSDSLLTAIARAGISVPNSIALFATELVHRWWRSSVDRS